MSCEYISPLHTITLKFTRVDFSGWDIHDVVYSKELLISNKKNGYRDLLAQIDISTFRRIPWEDNIPLFLVTFLDPDTKEPICACPRGMLKNVSEAATGKGWTLMAGVEYEVLILSHFLCISSVLLTDCSAQYFQFKGSPF